LFNQPPIGNPELMCLPDRRFQESPWKPREKKVSYIFRWKWVGGFNACLWRL